MDARTAQHQLRPNTSESVPKAMSWAEAAKQPPAPLRRQQAVPQLAAQGAEAPAAPFQQQQMGDWAAKRQADQRRKQEVAARADAAKPQRRAAKHSAAQAAEVPESLVGAEPAAAEAAATPTAAQAAEEPCRQELAQLAADLCQQGKQGEARGQVAAAASSHAPQLAADASRWILCLTAC